MRLSACALISAVAAQNIPKNDFVQKERAREFGWDLLFSSGSSDENKMP